MDFSKLTEAELIQAEKDIRSTRDQRIKEAREKRAVELKERFKPLTIEMINIFVPRHRSTQCNDKNHMNGFYSEGNPECTRCAFLDIIQDGVIPPEYDLCVEFEKNGLYK